MKKKLLLLVICALFLVFALTGCNSEVEYTPSADTLVLLRSNTIDDYKVFYDKETQVMYVVSRDGIFSPLYNSDGSLKTYKKKVSNNDD